MAEQTSKTAKHPKIPSVNPNQNPPHFPAIIAIHDIIWKNGLPTSPNHRQGQRISVMYPTGPAGNITWHHGGEIWNGINVPLVVQRGEVQAANPLQRPSWLPEDAAFLVLRKSTAIEGVGSKEHIHSSVKVLARLQSEGGAGLFEYEVSVRAAGRDGSGVGGVGVPKVEPGE